MMNYPAPIQEMISLLKTFPGLGPRSAERMTLWFLGRGETRSHQLEVALQGLWERVGKCDRCGFYLDKEQPCHFCDDAARNHELLCVVEQPSDVLRIENSRAYRGLYHVLGGVLSPLDNIGPEELRMDFLVERVKNERVQEVIVALAGGVEGESTSHFLADLLSQEKVVVSRLAQGMPAGGGLEHVDEITLHHALQGRRNISN